jgi:hypothetical protein
MNNGNIGTVTLTPGGLEPAVLKIFDQVNEQAQLPVFVDMYIAGSGIDEERFTPEVRAAMVDYLRERGAEFESIQAVIDREYDELFALAYENAIARKAGRDDPIDAAHQPGGGVIGSSWDFSVDLFDDVEQQGVVRDNILAAGAIDYIYELGEHMGVFRLVDALVLNWASGSIDVVEGNVVSRLYRYWKLRDQRMSSEERGMVYRRVLNKGETDVLDRMVVNEELPNLWHNLMAEVADYIDKTERVNLGTSESSPVSRARIFQAIRDLQYNLTEFCTGMAHIQARELYAQLQECVEVLRDDDIMSYFGGNRRKSLWTVIEKMSRQEFGAAPNIAALRSLAVDGNTIFRFIADFSEGAVRQEEFARFLDAAEAYILNYSTVGGDMPAMGEDDEEEEESSELDDENEETEDF